MASSATPPLQLRILEMISSHFDEAYYRRYYRNTKTRVRTARELNAHGDLVSAYLKYLGQPVRRVLDVGCGLGEWQTVVQRHYPSATYTGVEISEYLCEKYGWRRASAVSYSARAPFDLVICHDVLQYLSDAEVTPAIRNLAAHCRGALSLMVPTAEDFTDSVDRCRTDTRVHTRPASWYSRRLRPHFSNVGGGLFLPKDTRLVLFKLQQAG